jgi:hypothetical protein
MEYQIYFYGAMVIIALLCVCIAFLVRGNNQKIECIKELASTSLEYKHTINEVRILLFEDIPKSIHKVTTEDILDKIRILKNCKEIISSYREDKDTLKAMIKNKDQKTGDIDKYSFIDQELDILHTIFSERRENKELNDLNKGNFKKIAEILGIKGTFTQEFGTYQIKEKITSIVRKEHSTYEKFRQLRQKVRQMPIATLTKYKLAYVVIEKNSRQKEKKK